MSNIMRDIHEWFGLSYSSYLVLPRSILQSMPDEWQKQFVALLDEAESLYGGYNMQYTVMARDNSGRFVKDPLRDYQRGRRKIEPKPYTIGA